MAEKSSPKGFSKGLVTDVDPRYQLEGSYRDAMNVKLVNTDGTTFTTDPSGLVDVPNFSFYYGTPEVWAEARDPANRPRYDLLYTSLDSIAP